MYGIYLHFYYFLVLDAHLNLIYFLSFLQFHLVIYRLSSLELVSSLGWALERFSETSWTATRGATLSVSGVTDTAFVFWSTLSCFWHHCQSMCVPSTKQDWCGFEPENWFLFSSLFSWWSLVICSTIFFLQICCWLFPPRSTLVPLQYRSLASLSSLPGSPSSIFWSLVPWL